VRLARTECGRLQKKCRTEKDNERVYRRCILKTAGSDKARINKQRVGSVVSDNTRLMKVRKLVNRREKPDRQNKTR